MSVELRIDKEAMVHIQDGKLLIHKKEQDWIICKGEDDSRDYYTVQ